MNKYVRLFSLLCVKWSACSVMDVQQDCVAFIMRMLNLQPE